MNTVLDPEVEPAFRRAPAPPRTRGSALGRTGKVLIITGASAGILAPFLLYVWAHVQIVTLGYRIEATEARIKTLEQENRALRLERGRSESLPAVEERAKKLGLIALEPDRIVVLEPTRRRPPADAAARAGAGIDAPCRRGATAVIDSRRPRRRLMLLVAGVVAWSIAIVVRLVQIQVYRADDLADMARRQHSSTVELDPMRGTIFDRNGAELAIAKDVPSIYAVPVEVEAVDKTATALTKVLKLDRRKVLGRLRLKSRDFVWIERKVTAAEAAAVAALHLPGIAFVDEPKRFYPRGALAAHVLGYVGLDNNGLGGIEQQFDADVRGIPGIKLTLRDARGFRFLPEPGGHPDEPGRNVVLAIDAAIQHVVERELAAAISENQARGGVAIVLDPWTGDVLALAGEPTFDPNHYLDAEPEVRRNRAVQEAYEPGSTFKVVTLTAAIEGRHVRLDELIDCGHGSITLNGARVTDHDPFDLLTPTAVLAHSSNVGAIVIGSRVPAEDFYRQIRRFGFGKPTGIELPGETAGILRPPEDWSGLSKPMMSMGYEVAVTPIQLAAVFAAVANGGTLVKPRLVLRIEEHDGRLVRAVEPLSVRRVASPATVATLTAMLEEVVKDGTATAAAIEGVTVAGKTGTAKKLVAGVYTSGHYVASFGAFAPSRRPRITVLVVLDEPRAGEYYGGRVAAPVVKRILTATLAILGEPAEGRTVSAALADFYPAAADTALGQRSVLTWKTR